jgi:hypothetical protein
LKPGLFASKKSWFQNNRSIASCHNQLSQNVTFLHRNAAMLLAMRYRLLQRRVILERTETITIVMQLRKPPIRPAQGRLAQGRPANDYSQPASRSDAGSMDSGHAVDVIDAADAIDQIWRRRPDEQQYHET